MADVTLSTLIDKFLQETSLDATEKDSIREYLGLKTTDPVTFKNLILSGLSLTGSTATSCLDISATWNTTGTPTAIKLDITDVASNAASLFMDFRVGGVTRFSVGKAGWVTSLGPSSFARIDFQERWVAGNCHAANGQLNVGNSDVIGWSSNSFWHGALDLVLRRAAAATLQLGTTHATIPTAQTIKAHDVVTGTGADLTLKAGSGSDAYGAVYIHGKQIQLENLNASASIAINNDGTVTLAGLNRAAFVADATGGSTEDAECRTLANALKAALISHGLMAAS